MRLISSFAFCALFVCLTACSAPKTETSSGSVNTARRPEASNTVSNTTNATSPAPQNDRVNTATAPVSANSSVVDSAPAPDVAANTPGPSLPYPMSEVKRKKFERFRSMSANTRNPGPPPPPIVRPAPEDSEFSSSLTDVATETRTFKSHPKLARVQKISDGKGSTVKVYLRSGKVITMPGDKIANIGQESSANILRAAGVTP